MHTIGFSTGALAKGDFLAGVSIAQRLELSAIELSALRDSELEPLLHSIDALPLNSFRYVSVHAPSNLGDIPEPDLVHALRGLPPEWPVIVHPDVIRDFSSWRFLGQRLCLENMDQRKSLGRTVAEMEFVFERLPEAGFCFDIGHARQVDPTMGIAISMLQRFRSRLKQVHMSEVDPKGIHIPISFAAMHGFQLAAKLIPESCPIILESTVRGGAIEREINVARSVLEPRVREEEYGLGGARSR